MLTIPEGSYQIGTDERIGFMNDNEGPQTIIHLSEFLIDETTVTNQAFKKFVDDTGYITESEKFGWSFVFHYFLSDETKRNSQTVPGLKWWYAVPKADWLHPEGPGTTIKKRMNHPVVQVSRNDAIAYCRWANKRLPTEAQWEVAAKGGTSFEKYPWGKNFLKDNQYHCNIWQGNFPMENSLDDGFANTAPAKYYEPNEYGLYQAIGNVWEWCVNPARIDLDEFTKNDSDFFWGNYQQIDDADYATRGGSFLCHESYCRRYRIAARNGNTGMSAANNLGFRCVR